ncbi:hypothetical protein GALL_319020 [mine drainage metagenome]|uniref:Uncharacterized protein n=1 Tax=mine drainage metagenome TaxID=410659 RepID=A0A1J5RDN4_9ZZZZ
MDGHELGTGSTLGDPGTAPDQRLSLRTSGHGHDDALASGPRRLDTLVAPVRGQRVVHPVGQPQQGQLSQGGQVPDPEVGRQRRVDLLGAVHVPVRQSSTQRLRRQVDQLDLVGVPDHAVRDGLPLAHAGDRVDVVVQRLEVLHVDGGDDVDPGIEQLLDVLPALLVPGAGDVRVRELVDHRDARGAPEHRVDVELGELASLVGQRAARHLLEADELGGGAGATVRLDEAHHHVGATVLAAVGLVEHRVRLPDARRRTEVDGQPPGPGGCRLGHAELAVAAHGAIVVRARLSASTSTRGSPRIPSVRPWTCCSTSAATRATGRPRAAATRATCSRA